MFRARSFRIMIVLMALQLFPAFDGTAAELDDSADRWLPSASAVFGIDVFEIRSSSRTSPTLQPKKNPNPPLLRPGSQGDVTVTGFSPGLDLQLMTPSVTDRFYQPRFFVHGGFDWNTADDTTPSAEGAFGMLALPLDAGGQPPINFRENQILGQGSRTRVKVEPFQVRAGIGMAFSFDVWGRRVRLKPSVEYIRRELELTGDVQRAVQLPGTPTPMTNLDQVRSARIETSEKRIFNGVGPGLEAELDAARTGPFIISLFLGADIYYFPGERREQIRGVDDVGEVATFDFSLNPWSYRGDVGIRLRWQPK